MGQEGSADCPKLKITQRTFRPKQSIVRLSTLDSSTLGNEKLLYSKAIMKYSIIVLSSQHKRFSKQDFLGTLGDRSRGKSRTPPPACWEILWQN